MQNPPGHAFEGGLKNLNDVLQSGHLSKASLFWGHPLSFRITSESYAPTSVIARSLAIGESLKQKEAENRELKAREKQQNQRRRDRASSRVIPSSATPVANLVPADPISFFVLDCLSIYILAHNTCLGIYFLLAPRLGTYR